MSTPIDQKEYLKRYLGDGKKKKKVKTSKGKGTRIVDDDVSAPTVADGDDGLLEAADEKPQVAAVTADAPPPGADKRWKTLDECDLEELESQREILSESLKQLQEAERPASSDDEEEEEEPAAGRRRRHDSESGQSGSGSGSGSASESESADSARRRDSDASPPRQRPRRREDRADSDASPPRRRQDRADSDASPPRRRQDRAGSDPSPPRRRQERAGSDPSPPRRQQRGQDSDESPPRRKPGSDERPGRQRGGRRDASADSASPPRSWRRPQNQSSAESPRQAPPSHTQDGKRAGLQDINALREENRLARQREKKQMTQMDESQSGKNAETKVRGRKLQENKEKAAKKAEEEAKAKERKKKYDAWGKGLKQAEERRARLEDTVREANKPLARYAGDGDLEADLKRRQRQDDPMAEYMQRKKAKQDGPVRERPRYNKSDPPPNRYGIWPGYRWDGVDRSNGFEKALFLRKNAKKARDVEAYQWSTEDM